jgi:hypothetical protein
MLIISFNIYIFISSSLDFHNWSCFLPTVPMIYLVVAKKTDDYVVHFFTSLALPLVQMDLRIYPFP